jgi:hypothetical protein
MTAVHWVAQLWKALFHSRTTNIINTGTVIHVGEVHNHFHPPAEHVIPPPTAADQSRAPGGSEDQSANHIRRDRDDR